MKGNEISAKELRPDAVEWLTKLHQTVVIKEYGKGNVRNYCQEMRLLFKYFNHKAVADIRQADIEQYLQYIKKVHKVGRAKCRSAAQACSFFFKRILPAPYIVPSNLYPKKQFILPNIMTEEEVAQLFAAPPVQRVNTPVALRLQLQTGKDITLCPVCKLGKMELVATFIYHHGCLVDVAQPWLSKNRKQKHSP